MTRTKQPLRTTGTEVQYRCVFCGDSPGQNDNLYYNPEKKIFHCFKCGVSGTSGRLKRLSYNLPDHTPLPVRQTTGGPAPANWLEGYQRLEIDQPTGAEWDYATRRGWTGQWEVGTHVNLPFRLVIPIRQDGRLVHYQARGVFPGMKPKYLNPHHRDGWLGKQDGIFYGPSLNGHRFVLCEGPFDAWSISACWGFAGYASLGKELSKAQVARIVSMTDEVIVCLDPDASPSVPAKKLYEAGLKVYVVTGLTTDPADTPRDTLFQKLERAEPWP